MITNEEWGQIIAKRVADGPKFERIDLLGGPSNQQRLESLRVILQPIAPTAQIEICAAGRTLRDSIAILNGVDELFAIDSAVLHIARLLQVPCTSFWGPSAPFTRMHAQDVAPHTISYAHLPCSPCVHLTPTPPCHGNNLCMRLAVDPDAGVDRNPPWLAQILPPRKAK